MTVQTVVGDVFVALGVFLIGVGVLLFGLSHFV